MTSVTFPPALGGDGSTVTDDANPTTGLANGGHRTRFVPALAQTVAMANGALTQALAAQTQAQAAAASAATATAAPGTNATSATSLTVGTGSKVFTLAQTGKSFVVGQWVTVSDSATPATNWMLGAITAFTAGTGAITVNVIASAGTLTGTSWVVAASAPIQYEIPLTVVAGTAQTALAFNHYALTNAAASTLTLPATPASGDVVVVTWTNGLTTNVIARNGQTIMGLAEDMTLNAGLNGTVQLRFVNSSWRIL